MFAPLLVFVYKRPEHTAKMLNKLNACLDSGETDLYIFCDAAKDMQSAGAVVSVRKIIRNFQNENTFRSVHIVENQINMGLANSIIQRVTEIINIYQRVIVVEDDLLVSKDFIRYMNQCLDFYKSNNKIWSVCGFSFPMKALENYKHDVFLGYRGGSWGWGTWKDRWETVDWEIKDYRYFVLNFYKRSRFNQGGNDMAMMLDMQMRHEIDSWAIRWNYNQFKQNKYTIFPGISMVQNIGLDGSGTHSGKSARFFTSLSTGQESFHLENVELDKKITKEFRRKFSSKFPRGIKGKFRNLLLNLYCLKNEKGS